MYYIRVHGAGCRGTRMGGRRSQRVGRGCTQERLPIIPPVKNMATKIQVPQPFSDRTCTNFMQRKFTEFHAQYFYQ